MCQTLGQTLQQERQDVYFFEKEKRAHGPSCMRIPANLATVNIPIRTVCWLLLLLLPFIIIYIVQSQLQYMFTVFM